MLGLKSEMRLLFAFCRSLKTKNGISPEITPPLQSWEQEIYTPQRSFITLISLSGGSMNAIQEMNVTNRTETIGINFDFLIIK